MVSDALLNAAASPFLSPGLLYSHFDLNKILIPVLSSFIPILHFHFLTLLVYILFPCHSQTEFCFGVELHHEAGGWFGHKINYDLVNPVEQ